MADRIHVGDKLPFFLYDTPYSAKNRFRDLLSQRAPLVLVFMANFGHPITRTFASRYANTYAALQDGGFALVVRSRADKLSRSIGPNTLPYPLLCDAAGVLYEHLNIPTSKSTLMSYSLEGWRILLEAKKQGYKPTKGAEQQLPLTLILDRDGTVLFWEPESGGVFHDGVRFVRSAGQNMCGLSSYACFDGNGQLLRNDTSAAVQAAGFASGTA